MLHEEIITYTARTLLPTHVIASILWPRASSGWTRGVLQMKVVIKAAGS